MVAYIIKQYKCKQYQNINRKLLWLVLKKIFFENWEPVVEFIFYTGRKIIAGLNTDRAEKVMLGNEEIWQCFTLQVSHEILQQKREAVVEIGEPPFAIASSLCAGMQESGLGVVGAELGQLLRVFVLEFPQKVLQ